MRKEGAKVPMKREPHTAPDRPWNLFEEMRREMEDLWNRGWLPRLMEATPRTWEPMLDVYRHDGDLVVRAEMPGVKKEDLEITFDNGDLVLQAERREETEVEEEHYFCTECHHGRYFRRLHLPYEVDPEKIRAHLEDGVLEVDLPLAEEERARSHKITVS